ncbi:alpha/beta hydrolase [Brumimicrobium glaciale]|uniref:Alpha/beta hydrolase n=1 Tax=Brumimicrobium glaciale TaxID=200475 RepID=A0A4Q4KME5_9FLAO|nr:alpha/beta hydrolase [Brumimicrobium glaciale]RYM34573.1 alpha/beta hydrolase [Brumimicrobium glaciale]
MDLNKDYSSQTIQLKPDYEGEVTATLISSKFNRGNRKSVLYIHGYIDYFFQAHLGEEFNAHDFDFYAIDLRKYGRSLLKHQHPNYCKDIAEYFEEISITIRQINESSDGDIFLLGHSTGGLIASNYMNYGQEKDLIKALILNSPFLDFNLTSIEKNLALIISKPIAGFFPYGKISGALSPAYAESIHKDFHGEWNFNLDWKPIKGFPTYFKWILAIRTAQNKLKESNIKVPILVMHSSSSARLSKYSEKATHQDIVLNINDIKSRGVNLGDKMTMLAIENGLHDLFLSAENVRNKTFKQMFSWLKSIDHKE